MITLFRRMKRAHWLSTHGSTTRMLFIGGDIRVLIDKDKYIEIGRPQKIEVEIKIDKDKKGKTVVKHIHHETTYG